MNKAATPGPSQQRGASQGAVQASATASRFARAVEMHRAGRLDDAHAAYEGVLKDDPRHVDTLNLMAMIASQRKGYARAVALYDRAIAIRPTAAEAHHNRGTALLELRQLDAAVSSYDRAIALKPEYARAHYNRGNALKALDRFEEAASSYRKAIALQPGMAEAHYNLGVVLRDIQQLDAAIASFDRAVGIRPGYADAHLQKSAALLLKGEFSQGWDLYEWRWKIDEAAAKRLVSSRPAWVPGCQDHRVLVWAEQGIGDEIMFASMFAELARCCSQVVVKTDARLIPLLERSFPDFEFFPTASTVPETAYDSQVPMGDLLRHFRATPDSLQTTRSSYLKAGPERSSAIRKALRADDCKLCGVSWRSTNKKSGDVRSLELKQLIQGLRLDNIRFVNLQYGDTESEVHDVQADSGVEVLRCADVDNFHDLDGLAALIEACDVVVSIDNTTVHLAGALGKPTWLLLPHVPDWRWLVDLDGHAWYASVTSCRQQAVHDWSGALERVGADLKHWAGTGRFSPPSAAS